MPAQQDQSLIHREMARVANDIHRVRNPRDEDFDLVWDSYIDVVPANGTYDFETFKVDKYLREMTNLILAKRQQKAVDQENKRRRDRGEKEMDKWEGQAQHTLEGKFAITEGAGNLEARRKIYKELYVGLVKEFGVEKVQRKTREAKPSTHEELMSEILSKKVPVSDSKPPILSKVPTTPLEQLNQPQLRKVAKEKGIKTTNTDKKQELIEKISEK